MVVAVHGDDGLADDRRFHVNGCVGSEQQLLRAHGGDAARIETDLLLEQRNGLFGDAAEVAVQRAAVVTQLLEAHLHGQHAVVAVASAQQDVA